MEITEIKTTEEIKKEYPNVGRMMENNGWAKRVTIKSAKAICQVLIPVDKKYKVSLNYGSRALFNRAIREGII